MSGQDGIDSIRAKQGAGDKSLDPDYHADALQQVFNESNGHWHKITDSQPLLANDFRRIDAFANDSQSPANITLTLPPIADLSAEYNRDLYNDSLDTYLVFLQKNAVDGGGQVIVGGLEASQGINFGLNEAGDDFILRDIKGVSPIPLDVTQFGDFDAVINATKPSNTYFITGTGLQIPNPPTGVELNPTAIYTFIKNTVNTGSAYLEEMLFYSTFDGTNKDIGRRFVRAGGNFGGAVAAGWKPEQKEGYFDYSSIVGLQLTTTPTVLTGWGTGLTPVGVIESGGEFTVTQGGLWKIDIERIYRNEDSNPALLVNVRIIIEADDQQGGGYVEIVNRVSPISSATANDEPAILTFTSPAILPVIAGTKFRIKFSGEDNGANPTNTSVLRCDVVGFLLST